MQEAAWIKRLPSFRILRRYYHFFLRSYLFFITPQETGGLISTSRSRASY
jgi:hypothetical protein